MCQFKECSKVTGGIKNWCLGLHCNRETQCNNVFGNKRNKAKYQDNKCKCFQFPYET